MKPINNLLILTFMWFLSFSTLNAQVLKNTSLNLNAGGIIHDMAYDSYYKAYIVVGSFDSINGQARKNLAFINASDFTVMTQAPITSINGEIRSVEVRNNYPINNPLLGIGMRHRIFIGGKFNSVNASPRINLAQLVVNHYASTASGTLLNYSLTTWASKITDFGVNTASVNDLEIRNDTLFAGGTFVSFAPTNGLTNDVGNLLLYDINSATGNCLPMLQSYTNATQADKVYEIELLDNSIFVGGELTLGGSNANLKKVKFDNSYVSFTLSGISGPVWDFDIHANGTDTTILGFYKISGGDVNSKSHLTGIQDISQANWGPDGFLESYQNKIFGVSIMAPTQLRTRMRSTLLISGITNTNTLNANWTTVSGTAQRPRSIFREKNFLFLSGNTLTTVNGQSRKGLAVFCLEPLNAKDFTSGDLTICEGNYRTYTIPTADYATGYKWTYTGSGATYRIAGTSNAFQPLSSINITDVTANSIEIHFDTGTTGGTLTVEPFCNCNTSTDYLYSVGKSIVLTTAPLPTISMVDSMGYTCIVDTLQLQINTTTSGVSYFWEFQNDTLSNASTISINKFDNPYAGYYFGTVIEPINGCSRTDSLYVYFNTYAAPIFPVNVISSSPAFTCLTDSIVLNGAVPNAAISWATSANPTNSLPTPLTLYSIDTLNLIMIATYNSNGCVAQTNYSLSVDQTPTNGGLVGYSNQLITDTINCYNPTLTLECSVVGSIPGTAQWMVNSIPSGNLLTVTTSDSAGMDPIYQTTSFQYQTLNPANGCTQNYDVVMFFDLENPFVASQANASLNCSQSSVAIAHVPTAGNVVEGWLDANQTQTGLQTLTASNVGEFYYQVQNTQNGCFNTDTVNVIQTTELMLDLIDDTLICPNQTITVSVSPINNTEFCTYAWSDGSQSQTTSAIGGVDTELSVIVSNTSGCIGYDTVQVMITDPVIAEFETVSSCTSSALQITSVTGGSGNYSYSLDNQNWQTSTAFTDLSFGNYVIFIKDDLGCTYNFNKTIDGSGAGPDLNFLVSTYNEIGDTIAFVNISSFAGFDSLTWTIPSIANVFSADDSLMILSIDAEGWYDIQLNGFIDTCGYSFVKSVYFGNNSPLFDTENDTKGIDSLSLFPNPTTGMFTVSFTLGIEQNYTMVVTNLQGQPLSGMDFSGSGTSVTKDFTFPSGTPPGNYRLHIIADFDAEQHSIILSN